MKRTLSILSLLFIVSSAFGDLLIERSSQTVRLTGQSIERTLKFQGYVIRDLDGTNGASIRTFTAGGHKLYEINRESTPVLSATVRGANGRQFLVVTAGNTESNDVQIVRVRGLLVKGLNTSIPVSDSREIVYPRALRGSSHQVDFDSGQYRVTETLLTRMFSQTETRDANARGNTVDEAVTRIVQRLEAAGYSAAP